MFDPTKVIWLWNSKVVSKDQLLGPLCYMIIIDSLADEEKDK